MSDLLEAIFNCDLRKLKVLLPDHRRVNCIIPQTEGCTPLHLVAGIESVSGKENVLNYLLDMGADPNARSDDDLTPVHIAAMWNNCLELEKLLQNHGNPWLTDNGNKNSFDLAMDNHAYEAYQLLNRYLAEERLDFRNGPCKNNKYEYITESASINGMRNGDFTHTKFYSANENMPLYFSSTEDESDYSVNISKMLKRSSVKNQNLIPKQNVDVCSSILNKVPFLPVSNAHKSNVAFRNVAKTINCATGAKKKRSDNDMHLSSDETDMDFISEFLTEGSDTVLDTDNESGIFLVQRHSSPYKSPAKKLNDSTSGNVTLDWKACSTNASYISSCDECLSHSTTSTIPNDIKFLSNSAIFGELQKLGDEPGPITDALRDVYLRRLAKLKKGCNTACVLRSPKYSAEVYSFLEGKMDTEKVQNLIASMAEEFSSTDTKTNWREGNQRCCFNYFLLDPRVTQSLPTRLKQLSYEKAFLTFLDALFYVGKGTKGRPYNHLLEAAKAETNSLAKSDKIKHILEIWKSGYGVISLHCFNNCIPVESYTQEACIIEAIGLENITNIKIGDFYGKASKWKKSWKKQVGVILLHRALQILIYEGEKQIFPKDVRRKLHF